MATESEMPVMQQPQAAPNKYQKRGFTLTEIAIVLGIIGLILGAIWVAAAAVYTNQRVNHANTSVLQLAQAVRSLYATTPSTGVGAVSLITTLIAAKAVPSDLVNAAANGLIDPWPSGVTDVWSTAASDAFVVILTQVPRDACISLLTMIGGQSRDASLYNADAVATAAPAAGDAIATGGGPITVAVTPAIASAAAVTAGNTNGNVGGCVAGGPLKIRLAFSLGT